MNGASQDVVVLRSKYLFLFVSSDVQWYIFRPVSYQLGYYWRLNLSRLNLVPINSFKERMWSDLLLLVPAAKSLHWILRQKLQRNQALNIRQLPTRYLWKIRILQANVNYLMTYSFADILGLLAPDPRVPDIIVGDVGEQLLLVLPSEGGVTCHHLIQQHSTRPPVNTCNIIIIIINIIIITRSAERTRRHFVQSAGRPDLATCRVLYLTSWRLQYQHYLHYLLQYLH